MLSAIVQHHHMPLPTRIQHYLRSRQIPCHYTIIARVLQIRNPRKVMQTCVRMAHDGRLRWCGEGMYALAALRARKP